MNHKEMLDKFAELEAKIKDLEAEVAYLRASNQPIGPKFTPDTCPNLWNPFKKPDPYYLKRYDITCSTKEPQ